MIVETHQFTGLLFIFVPEKDCFNLIYNRSMFVAPRLSPADRWDRLQPPRDPTNGLSGYRKNGWMDNRSM